jgi:hypothetical protein
MPVSAAAACTRRCPEWVALGVAAQEVVLVVLRLLAMEILGPVDGGFYSKLEKVAWRVVGGLWYGCDEYISWLVV